MTMSKIIFSIKNWLVVVGLLLPVIHLWGVYAALDVHRPDTWGLEGKYFDNLDWQGKPLFTSVDCDISSTTLKNHRERFSHNRYSVEWTGYIDIWDAAAYSFSLNSDDGSWLFIDGRIVVDNGGMHGLLSKEGQVTLTKGLHNIRIRYFQVGGQAVLRVLWNEEGQVKTVLDSAYLLPASTSKLYIMAYHLLPYLPDSIVALSALLGIFLCRIIFHLEVRPPGPKSWQRYFVSGIIPIGIFAAWGASRTGQYFLDDIIVDHSGRVTAHFLRLGYAFYYTLIPLALVILTTGFCSVKHILSSNFQRKKHNLSISPTSLKGLPLLLLAAMIMNGSFFIRHPNFGGDAFHYFTSVYHLIAGRGPLFMQLPPGYGLLMYAVSLFTRNIVVSAMLISAFSYLLSSFVAYYIGMKLAGKYAAFLSAFFFIFCPFVVRFSILSFISMWYIFLTFLAFAVYIHLLKQPNYRLSSLLGVILAVTILTREEGVVLAAGVLSFGGLLAFIDWVVEKPRTARRAWKQISYPLTTVIMIITVVGGTLLAIYLLTGHWMYSERMLELFRKTDVTKFLGTQQQTSAPSSQAPKEVTKSEKNPRNQEIKGGYIDLLRARFAFTIGVLLKGCIHITIHAVVPLFFIFSVWGVALVVHLSQNKTLSLHFPKDAAYRLKIVCSFLIFMSPIIVAIVVNNPRLRYTMHNAASFLLMLFAILIITLLSHAFRQHISALVAFVCVISLATATGLLFTDSKLFKNRYLSLTDFWIDKSVLGVLRDDGVPKKVIHDLKPLKEQKFYYRGVEFWDALDRQLDQDEFEAFRWQIFKWASIPVSYTTLLDVSRSDMSFETYFSGVILWLRGHYHKDMKIMVSANLSKASLLLFLANGGKTIPAEDTVFSVPEDLRLHDIARQMKMQHITCFILMDTDNLAAISPELLPLWQQPERASELGLQLSYADQKGAQVYTLN